MKISTIFLVLALIIVSAGFAGCTGRGLTGPDKTTVPQTQVTTTVVVEVPETTTPLPATSVPLPAAATTLPVTTPTLASANDIRDLFLDVTYSSTNRLERLNYISSDRRVVISAISGSNADIALIEKTAQDFNDASPTVKLSENVKETGTGDISIKYLPQEGLEAIKLADVPESGPFTEVLTRTELYQGSVPAAKILRGAIYINANLKDNDRRHVLVKSLMYELGLTGETTKFPDSVFYAGENTNTVLTTADKKIITMLYAEGFYNGMNIDQVRSMVYIPG
jgi:hypothetical protein